MCQGLRYVLEIQRLAEMNFPKHLLAKLTSTLEKEGTQHVKT